MAKQTPYQPSPGPPPLYGRVVVSDQMVRTGSFFNVRNQLRSVGFGLLCGSIVVAVFLFMLFNEVVVAAFIRPSNTIEIPPAVDQAGVPVDTSPKVRIPRINVDIPVVYDLSSNDDKEVEAGLDRGVIHYPTTVLPGQAGNAVYFGHSSNNIFNPGKYKFAFVLLHDLAVGDQFYLTHDAKLYTYKVISSRVVKPTDLSVLGPVDDQPVTATLITCDPPGTSTNRLVVVGRQTDPDPAVTPDTKTTLPVEPTLLPQTKQNQQKLLGNGPGLLTRLWRSIVN